MLLLVAMQVACDKLPLIDPEQQGAVGELERGVVRVVNTANGLWENQTRYNWIIEASGTPDYLELNGGECDEINYSITAIRTLEAQQTVHGVRGEVIITNDTDAVLDNFTIQSIVRYRIGESTYQALAVIDVDVSNKPSLEIGETYSYNYESFFSPIAGASYVISSYLNDGYSNIASEHVPFELPEILTDNEIDAEATVTYNASVSDGFSFTENGAGSYTLMESGDIDFIAEICNESAECNTNFNFPVEFNLSESSTQENRTLSAAISIQTGGCEECGECEGGVTQLTLRYLGSGQSLIQVYRGNRPRPHKLLFEGVVSPGEAFTFDGNRHNDRMGRRISVYVDGERNTRIVTNCGKPVGPGLIKGDFEVVSGYSSRGGLLCPIDELPWCETGRPQVLTAAYTGQGCEYSNHSQNPHKVRCEGDPGYASLVRIVACDKSDPFHRRANIWFDGMVGLDDSFDIDSTNQSRNRLKRVTWIHVLDLENNILQSMRFITSCREPLQEGDQFGSIVLEDFTPAY
ncbi:MAG: hypothetical protein GF315_11780 [candidate division Zixibacteria bacterium]|nr:hypothetical protein [candidate division Zixibacteria bacterium]